MTSEIDYSPLHVNLSVDLVLKGYFESREIFWMRKLDAKRLMDIGIATTLLSLKWKIWVEVVFFAIPMIMIEKA